METDFSETAADNARVLSLQSHVVSGYVGNRAAVFPQQVLGFDVDFINSVQFSNHTGYPSFKGKALIGDELDQLTEGLLSNGLVSYDYLLTGYIGSESFLSRVLNLLDSIESANPNVKYICDPVLGDNGKYYVPKELVGVFIEKVIPRAYLITPNQFEAELLSGMAIKTEQDAIAAMKTLHLMGPKLVVLTSADLVEYPGRLCCYVIDGITLPESIGDVSGILSQAPSSSESGNVVTMTRVIVDKLDGHFTGTGDAAAALMLAWSHLLGPGHAGRALQHTIGTMQAILKLTAQRQTAFEARTLGELQKLAAPGETPVLSKAQRARSAELCIIQGKRFIENPPLDGIIIDTWKLHLASI